MHVYILRYGSNVPVVRHVSVADLWLFPVNQTIYDTLELAQAAQQTIKEQQCLNPLKTA